MTKNAWDWHLVNSPEFVSECEWMKYKFIPVKYWYMVRGALEVCYPCAAGGFSLDTYTGSGLRCWDHSASGKP